jgi:O-antigen/teichoic acid export membrane protein
VPSNRKNTITSFLYKGFQSAIGFVISVLTARYLSNVDRGDFQTATVNVTSGMTFVGGYTNYYAFAIAKRPEDRVNAVQMGNLFIFTLSILFWIVTLCLIFIPNPFFHITAMWKWTLLVMPMTFIFGFGSRILNALHEIPWLNRVNILQPLVFLLIYLPLAVFARIPETERLLLTYVIWMSSYIVQIIVTMVIAYQLLKRTGVLKWRFSKVDWRGTVDYGSWSSIGQLVSYANYRIDFWMVRGFLYNELAIYGAAVAAAEVLNTLAQSISSVVFARMTGGNREDAIHITEIATRQTLISSTIAALGLYIVAPLFVVFYGPRYAGLLSPFFILIPGLIIKGASNVIIQYATNSIGKPRISIWMNGISIVVNAICCIFLIPTMGMNGGALASTISYVAGFIVYIIWFGKVTGRSPHGLWRIRKSDFVPYFDLMHAVFRRLRRS